MMSDRSDVFLFSACIILALLVIARLQARRYRQFQERALAQSKAASEAGLALQDRSVALQAEQIQALNRIADALENRA